MYSDNRLVLQLLSLMKQFGIRQVVVSPGSRHFPLIHSMENDPYFTLYSVVDERSAAFFALGLIQQNGMPAAVCCTSGTSAINYGSAVVEAFYQGLPLVVLTADRLPELLGQKEEQMFRQHDVYEGFIRYQGQLREVVDGFSEWYCNRIINEAFLELDHHGRGPVHLNIPIENHHTDRFQTAALPEARRIRRIGADADEALWQDLAARLAGRRVLILWGQSAPMDGRLRKALDRFAERFDCAILADRLSNCRHPRAIQTAYLALRALTPDEVSDLAPDIVLSLFGNYSFNGEIKGYLRSTGRAFECWDVGRSSVSDPFRRLTTIIETNEAFFFERLAGLGSGTATDAYAEGWARVDRRLPEPAVGFGEIDAIGRLMAQLPDGAAVHVANSLPIRLVHLFRTDRGFRVFCNRGVNGIDGCMSSAVGFAAATTEPVFLLIGDLTFFYDMNALWNRHLSKNLRILLLNNEGGGVMHVPLAESLGPILSRHVSAGHVTSAKGWAESLGFRYFAATSAADYEEAVRILADPAEPGPILVEAFSRKEEDVRSFKGFLGSLRQVSAADALKARVRRRMKAVLRRIPLVSGRRR